MSETFSSPLYQGLPAAAVAQGDERTSATRTSFFFLCLFTVAIYARPEDIFPSVGRLHLTFLLGACTGLAYLGAWLSGKASFIDSRPLRLMMWLTFWFVLGLPFAYWRGGSFQVLTGTWFKTLLVFFLLTQTLTTLSRIRVVLWAVILSELAVTAYSILDPSRSMWVGDRLSGVSKGFLGWNFLGIAAALTTPYILALFITRPSILKSIVLASATAAVSWMLILTASRSGIMTFLLSVLLSSILVLKRSALGKFVALGVITAVLLAIAAAPGVFWQRIQTIWSQSAPTSLVSASADASEQERRAVLMDSITYTLQNPLFGLGLGNFSVARGTTTGVPSGWLGTHNSFTELSSEAGLPALLIFLALLGSSIRRMWRLAKADTATQEDVQLNRMARATLASLMAFVFGAFFAHIAYEYFLYYPVAIGVGLEYVHRTAPRQSVSTAAAPVFDCRDLVRVRNI